MDNTEKLIILIGVLIVIFVIFMGYKEIKEENKNMAACMQEHKEYECVAMLKNNTKMYPVIIPHIGR